VLFSKQHYKISLHLCEGLGLGHETKEPRSWSWSRDHSVKVLVSRPRTRGLGLGLETRLSRSWSRVF